MPDLQGLAFFPGINQIIKASYTLTHGVNPGYIEVDILPQEDPINIYGTFTFTFGDQILQLADCKIDLATAVRNESGMVLSLKIFDKRWRWKNGSITGEYNLVDAKQVVLDWSKKTPQELAKLCLKNMGETKYSVSDMPNSEYLYTSWQGANPALELEQLCNRLGCAVVLSVDGSVKICNVGIGAFLPEDTDLSNISTTVDITDQPYAILIRGAPVQAQGWLKLRAVGLEVGGAIKPIDSLSYQPDDGWGKETHIFASITDAAIRKKAEDTVWRWYQVDSTGKDNKMTQTITLPDGQVVKYLRQILPLKNELVELFQDIDGVNKPKPIEVCGTYWKYNAGLPENTDEFTPYKHSFILIPELGVVAFDRQTLKWDSENELWKPADMWLKCSFNVKSEINNTPNIYFYYYKISGKLGKKETVDEKNVEPYTDNTLLYKTYNDVLPGVMVWSKDKWVDAVSKKDLDSRAKTLAQYVAAKYGGDEASDRTYNGLKYINPDGAIRQVQWTLNEQGMETRACRNTEGIPYIPTSRTKREYNSTRRLVIKGNSGA